MAHAAVRHLQACCAALLAGYGVALLANIVMFQAYPDVAGPSTGIVGFAPGLLAVATACWFLRQPQAARKAVCIGVVAATFLMCSGAPMVAQTPLSWSTSIFPGDFVVFGMARLPQSVVAAFSPPFFYMIVLLPMAVLGGLCGFLMSMAPAASARIGRLQMPLAAILFVAGLGSEVATTPSTWSPAVNQRIKIFNLQLPAGLSGMNYQGWASDQWHFAGIASIDDVFAYYERVFSEWRLLDRSAEDAIWIDSTGSVVAWLAFPVSSLEKPPATRSAFIVLKDVDRSFWQHRSRRTSSGRRVIDLVP